ncbi:MAG: hypothetical protein HC786_12240 [Richelia sp. CSU_2_1]|nr:hypothetical protein [Richelia sp. CSU_2_1]
MYDRCDAIGQAVNCQLSTVNYQLSTKSPPPSLAEGENYQGASTNGHSIASFCGVSPPMGDIRGGFL